MKGFVGVICAALMLTAASFGEPMEAERAGIEKTILDYIEGWYQGDAERMERALHPDLAKRAIMVDPKTGRSVINPVTASMMVEYTRAGGGTKTPKEKQANKITILDAYKEMASAKAISADYVDYLHLAKSNGRWVIVNALWYWKQEPDEGQGKK